MKRLGILSAAALGLMMSASVAFADDVTISVVGPMTGQLANIGDQFKQGAQAAADAINAAGGVNGNKIKIDIQDDQCDPKQAVSVAN
ncbi:MAG: branched-chain amino acid ABC transporter substrate-binding protein, partial [Mesorhizobium sp.]